MKIKPTEQLIEEHDSIKLMLRIIEKVCQNIESDQKVDPVHLDQIIEFIKGFADKCHHGKEEDQLFLALEQAGFSRDAGPIAVMLMEHDLGRGYVRAMNEALTEYKEGNPESASVIVENARNYISLLTQHIAKEDNILYPLADNHLSSDKQAELLEQFKIVNQQVIGLKKLEEFQDILNRLQKIYLD